MDQIENNTTRSSTEDPVRKRYDAMDKEYWNELKRLAEKHNLTMQDLICNYLAFIRRRDLPRLLAHYELFKRIVDLPGSIIELGVFMGSGFFSWANLLETFCPGDRVRKVFGFDSFEGYTEYNNDTGAQKFVSSFDHKLVSNFELLNELTALHNNDNLLRGVERCRLIRGNISDTVPEFVSISKGLRLSLLYIDVNLFEPTKIGLEHLYPLVVPGGIVAFNGYGQSPWEGEAKAIEEYFGRQMPTMRKFPFSTLPSAYFIKD